ncbi:hypothetical protein ACSBR2_024939 [Camellia fascicularis]
MTCIEGRNLELRKNLKCAKCLNPNVKMSVKDKSNEVTSPSQLQPSGFRTMDQGNVDSFRPTTPGHSPGVGHSDHD